MYRVVNRDVDRVVESQCYDDRIWNLRGAGFAVVVCKQEEVGEIDNPICRHVSDNRKVLRVESKAENCISGVFSRRIPGKHTHEV